jgi:acetolactate synthase small subunit
MKLSDFVSAIEANDLVILSLETVVDRSVNQLPEVLERINPRISVTNLTVESIAARLRRLGSS